MKAILLFQFIFIYSSIIAGYIDTVHFAIDMHKYNCVAKEKLKELFIKEKTYNNIRYSGFLLSNEYSINELQTLSIPVFGLKQQAKDYKCGDNIELLIDFKEDPYFQKVIIINNQKQVGGFNVLDSFNESSKIKDSIKGDNPFHLHSTPILYDIFDNKKTEDKILKYKMKNANVFIFMIKGLHGFWVVKSGCLHKLVGMTEEPANSYFIKQYGEEYVHDVSNDAFRTGYPYMSCKDFKGRAFKNVAIRAEIKE